MTLVSFCRKTRDWLPYDFLCNCRETNTLWCALFKDYVGCEKSNQKKLRWWASLMWFSGWSWGHLSLYSKGGHQTSFSGTRPFFGLISYDFLIFLQLSIFKWPGKNSSLSWAGETSAEYLPKHAFNISNHRTPRNCRRNYLRVFWNQKTTKNSWKFRKIAK